jgi:deoxyribonuclease-4
MNLGAHMSIAGGLPTALERGKAAGCSIIQMFLKNQVQWVGKPLKQAEIAEFKRLQALTGIHTVFAHSTYLINLCSPVDDERKRSVNAFHDELERAEALGLPYVVVHPGSHKGAGVEAGIARIVAALDELHQRTRGHRVQILLENNAGAGNMIGSCFEELQAIMNQIKEADRIGFCLDTCHLFTAGYDIRTKSAYEATMAAFETIVGLRRVKAFHLNDAKKGLGSGLDRHEHIGEGNIGVDAFRLLLNDPRVASLPMSLETPKDNDESDPKNLALLRSLRKRSLRGGHARHSPRPDRRSREANLRQELGGAKAARKRRRTMA